MISIVTDTRSLRPLFYSSQHQYILLRFVTFFCNLYNVFNEYVLNININIYVQYL